MANKEIKTLERTTKTSPTVPIQDFQKPLSDIGSANVMGQIGSKMAQTASNAFSEHVGYELGKDPHGEIMPAITESDSHFAAAYKTQSQATLGMQINQMTTEGQLELAKANRLTPELIQSYNENMQEGAKKIFALAPSGVKQNLESHFGNHMIQTNGQLQTRMLTEHKKDNYSKQVAYNSEQTVGIYNTARSAQGNPDALAAADKSLQENLTFNQANLENNVYTQAQHDANVKQAKLAYMKGKYNGELDAARNEGKSEEYLFEFSQNKPEELNYLEWDQVQKSLITNLKLSDTLKNQERQTVLQTVKNKIDTNTLTQNDLTKAGQELTKPQQAKVVSLYNINQVKVGKNRAALNDVFSNWADINTHLNNTQAHITAGFKEQVKNGMQAHPELTQAHVEVAVINSSPMEVKSYTAKIEGQLMSGNGEQMLSAGESWESIHRNKPNNIPISKNALATMIVFKDRLDASGDLDLAAQQATQIVSRKTTDDIDYINSLVKSFEKTDLKTNSQSMAFALDVADVKQSQLPSPFEFAKTVQREFEEDVRLTGSIESAKKLIKTEMGKVYGMSQINGKEQYVRLPIERAVQLPNSGMTSAIINSDVAEQVEEQFAENNKLFAKGESNFFFRITKRPDIKAAMSAAASLADIDNKDLEVRANWELSLKNQEVLRQFSESGQVEVEQVYKDGHVVKHKLSVRAGMFVNQSTNPKNPVVGGYDITGTTEGGATMPLIGTSTTTINGFFYHPNIQSANAAYLALNPFPELDGESLEEKFKDFKNNRKAGSTLNKAALSAAGSLTGLLSSSNVEIKPSEGSK